MDFENYFPVWNELNTKQKSLETGGYQPRKA